MKKKKKWPGCYGCLLSLGKKDAYRSLHPVGSRFRYTSKRLNNRIEKYGISQKK